jgi:hypothetical protein
VRYTRWQYDGPYPRRASKRDQLELLTGVSYDISPERWKPGGRKLRFGVMGGVPLTRGFLQNNVDEQQGYAVGLQVEYEFRERLSLGFSGLYRPLRGFSVSTFQGSTFRNEFTVLTWEFPVLATYALWNSPVWRPFIEGGASFRATGNLNAYNPSHYGATAGFGVETVARGVKIAPRLRYSRWANDSLAFRWMSQTRRDEVQLLVGVSF